MKHIKNLSLALLLTSSFISSAKESSIILGGAIGSSSVKIDSDIVVTDNEFDDEGLGVTYIAGYRWGNNVIAEANLSYASNNFFFEGLDYYETTQVNFMLGYSFDIAKHLRIVPKIGLSRWALDTQEGSILNSGTEERIKLNGTDLTYKLSIDVPLSHWVALSLSYAVSQLDIGTTTMSQFGVQFEF